MRRQTEKQGAAFKAMATSALIGLGAVPANGTIYEYQIATKHGLLLLSPGRQSIRTRFDDIPAEAPTGAPLNPYSGKWNFEFSEKPDGRELAVAIHSIRGILP